MNAELKDNSRNFIFESYKMEKQLERQTKIFNMMIVMAFVTIFIFFINIASHAQSVGLNNPNPHAKSLLDLTATDKGLLTPRMTQAQRIAMFVAPDASAKGMLVYQTDNTQGFYFYDGAAWQAVSANAGWGVNGNAGTSATTNFIGTTDNNDVVFKTNNIERMRVDVNGNIGIDTVAPKARLHVKSNSASNWPQIIVEEKDSNDYSRISFMNKGSNKFWTVAATSAVADSNSRFNIFNSSTFDLLTVTGTGKVGLSHTNPRQRLEVNGNITLTNDANNIRVNDIRVFAVTGTSNLFAGENAGINNTSGSNNTFVGDSSGFTNTTGTSNVAIGNNSLKNNLGGNWNVAVGSSALESNTSGYSNSGLGIGTLSKNTSGIRNTASGGGGLQANTTGFENTAAGYYALNKNTTASRNVGIGAYALFNDTTGEKNTALGHSSAYSLTSGSNNLFLGVYSGINCTTSSNNVFAGAETGTNNTTGGNNTFIGFQSGLSNTTASNNTMIGVQSGYLNTTGDWNVFVGNYSGLNNSTGQYNNFLGADAGRFNTTGLANTFMGNASGRHNTTGNYNVAIGADAGRLSTTASRNSFLGVAAGFATTTGSWNTALGTDALRLNQTGDNNVMIGFEAGYNTTVSNNVMMGFRAGRASTTGINNTFIGVNAGNANTTGNNNVAIGNNAQVGAALTNATAFGNNSSVTTSNSMVLGGIGVDAVNVGIGTTAPQHKLSFGNNLGSKISFWDGGTSNYGIGLQGYLLQYYTASINDDHAFGYGSSSAFTETMRIKGNGNVGIGTSAPNYKMHIVSGGSFPLALQSTSASSYSVMHVFNNSGTITAHFGYGNPSAGTFADRVFIGSTNATPFVLTTNNTERIRIAPTGEVGINTNAPTTDLEVNGFTKLGSDAPAVKMKKYTGNTAATANGNINFAHGLNQAKILSVEVLVLQSGGTLYPPENSTSSGAYYHYFVTSTSVYISNDASNSANMLNRPYRVLITYEE
nr:hypothetical protein [Bacteroidota bacterium]